MDEFGVLVESIGFKAQGKSAPMADLKHKRHVDRPKSVYNSYSTNGSFHGNRENQNSGDFHGFDDVFGGFVKNSKPSGVDDFDWDFISNNSSMNSPMYVDDDIFGGMPAKQSAPVDDLFGDFGGMGLGSNCSRRQSKEVRKNAQEFDDLIAGFGGSSPSRNSDNAETSWSPFSTDHAAKSASTSAGDPFIVLEQSSSQAYTSSGIYSKAKGQDARKGSVLSSVDELENFATGGESKYSNNQPGFSQKERVATATHDLDSFFNPNNMSKAKSTPVDPVFDSLFQNRGSSMEQKGPRERETSGISSSTKKPSSQTTVVDDFSFLFGGSAPPSDEFQEIEGESEERRRARLNHHKRTQQRMAKALAEKNQRDLQTQQEQEERHRIAETLNYNIKRWAAGKEGNLRALLSSLQDVLWPECGWQPVSLTDLITSGSVKKVYHKATLCVHPDKVQQKGANVQQKYTAEKVFDLLKEAWNKFTAEELR